MRSASRPDVIIHWVFGKPDIVERNWVGIEQKERREGGEEGISTGLRLEIGVGGPGSDR